MSVTLDSLLTEVLEEVDAALQEHLGLLQLLEPKVVNSMHLTHRYLIAVTVLKP